MSGFDFRSGLFTNETRDRSEDLPAPERRRLRRLSFLDGWARARIDLSPPAERDLRSTGHVDLLEAFEAGEGEARL